MQDLITIIEHLESQALGGEDSTLGSQRAASTSLYLGDPLGNEVEGRSQVVSKDVMDVVEWMKPNLAKVFLSGDEVGKFTPTSPEDTEAAEQETFYCNEIVLGKNAAFEGILTWMHEGLVTKNG